MSQVDQKRAFNKLKHDLEPWRNLIVQIDSVLTWEKNYYPAIIGGAISVFFIILYASNFSTITMLALSGLVAIAFDFVYPSFSRFLFNPDNWNAKQEARFEHVCGQLCNIKIFLGGWYEYIFTAKERKSTVSVVIIGAFLVALAWIGSIINNFLLMYLIILGLALSPGIQENSLLSNLKEKLGYAVNNKMQQFRDKSAKNE